MQTHPRPSADPRDHRWIEPPDHDPGPCLSEVLDPARRLGRLMAEVGGAIHADSAGVAMRHAQSDVYRVLAFVDKRRDGRPKRNTSFSAHGTCASWVEQTDLPFIGRDRSDLLRFSSTAKDMQAHGYHSNVVVGLDLGRGRAGILYCLSTLRASFSTDALAVLSRVRDILEPLTRAWLAAVDLVEREGERTEPDPPRDSTSPEMTLLEVERTHIQSVLERCNGVVEGERGAAARLGLRPSTLRSRLRKLGLR